jgi:hypothetical protein
MEQARAVDDKVVVEFSPFGQALPSRPRPLEWALSRTARRYMVPVKVGTRLTLVLLLALTPVVAARP